MSTILELCRDIPAKSFEPGTPLLAESKKSGLLYILIEGEVEILKGDMQVSTVSDPGAIFGEMSVLLDSPHTATVRARTACRAHQIDDAAAFLQANKEIAYKLSQILAERLQGVTTYLADLNRYVRSM